MTFEQFKKTAINGAGRIDRRFKERYGDITLEEMYLLHTQSVGEYFKRKEKIERFEKFLIKQGATQKQSNVSESRYYYYRGTKFRFSAHVYPTGSMSDNTLPTVDFAANPSLIDSIDF